MTDSETESRQWPEPKSRDVGLFADLRLYAEALELSLAYGAVSLPFLKREMGQRLTMMRLVLRQSERAVEGLLRELRAFGWLQTPPGSRESASTAPHEITAQGESSLRLYREDLRQFRRLLAVKMQELYTVPGWFVARLWMINPEGQGELILPAPPPAWLPASRSWDDHDWDAELERRTIEAATKAKEANPSAFPISTCEWLARVRAAWSRLSTLRPRARRTKRPASYAPRRRLALAMREATVALLFSAVPLTGTEPDFPGERRPLYPRTFSAWCPRLEALELIFYTDWHPWMNGRLLFPVSVFRPSASALFESVGGIRDPAGHRLWLHQPDWATVRNRFLNTLVSVHQHSASRTGTLYVSLQDVRDEVCRQLRISSTSFDCFLAEVVRELPAEDFRWTIAVESDIRQDQSGGAGQSRRPVYLASVPHTLLAMARLPQSGT